MRHVEALTTHLSPQSAAAQAGAQDTSIDIVEGLRYSTLPHREAAIRLGCSEPRAKEFALKLRQDITPKARERLEASIRKQEHIVKLKAGAYRVVHGKERIEHVAKELGTSNRNLYRYMDSV